MLQDSLHCQQNSFTPITSTEYLRNQAHRCNAITQSIVLPLKIFGRHVSEWQQLSIKTVTEHTIHLAIHQHQHTTQAVVFELHTYRLLLFIVVVSMQFSSRTKLWCKQTATCHTIISKSDCGHVRRGQKIFTRIKITKFLWMNITQINRNRNIQHSACSHTCVRYKADQSDQ